MTVEQMDGQTDSIASLDELPLCYRVGL